MQDCIQRHNTALKRQLQVCNLVEAHCYGIGRTRPLLSSHVAAETDRNVRHFDREFLCQLQQHCKWRVRIDSKYREDKRKVIGHEGLDDTDMNSVQVESGSVEVVNHFTSPWLKHL